jgi:hypothetical protein
MLRSLLLGLARKVLAPPVRRRLVAFEQATHHPEQVQRQLLARIVAEQRDTAFGRDHGFASITSVADYRRAVPIGPYEQLAPYIERVKAGEVSALLADPVVQMFALTSGTTSARKFIPVNRQYLDDYRRGWNIWGLKAYRDHQAVVLRPIVQLAGDPDEFRTERGVPCGSLSGFTMQVQKRIIRWLYCVPGCTVRIKDSRARLYVALRFSLTRSVGMLLTANPSTLLAFARLMDAEKEALVRDIADGTLARHLEIDPAIRRTLTARLRRDRARAALLESAIRQRGQLLPMDVWPADRLLIGTWTGGSVGPYLRQLPAYFGSACIRDLGLLASEGRMTLPLSDDNPAGVLDITTHFFEFIPEAEIDSPAPTVLQAHELVDGHSYYILPTTAYGLYRYHICDLMRVRGFFNRTPMLEFLGKGNRFANLTGEKLSEHHVTQAYDRTVRQTGLATGAYSLAPCWDEVAPYYGVFIEADQLPADPAKFLATLDAELATLNSEYAAKRQSQRLGPPRLMVLEPGTWQGWDRKRLLQSGGPPEQYKHPCLIGDLNFGQSVAVRTVHRSPG